MVTPGGDSLAEASSKVSCSFCQSDVQHLTGSRVLQVVHHLSNPNVIVVAKCTPTLTDRIQMKGSLEWDL